ncbi:MAG: hypothetical protein AAGF55_02470 [Pseudomonadota bacterium]
MGYSVHIERKSLLWLVRRSLSEEAWRNAIESTEGVRLAQNDEQQLTNPATGDTITRKNNPLDTEIRVNEEWVPGFTFSEGRATVRATRGFERRDDPLRFLMRTLSKKMGAHIIGDEGERYG